MPRTGRGKSKDKDKPHKNTGSAEVRKDFNPKTNAAMSAFRKDEERKINREIARNATNKEFRSDPYLGDEMSKEQSDYHRGRDEEGKINEEKTGLENYINERASSERRKKRKGTSGKKKEIPDFPY